MGLTYTEITLKNAGDVVDAERGYIKEQEIRIAKVSALVDTGTGTLVINEVIRQQLGLVIRGLRRSSLAKDDKYICKVTDPVEVHWQDRSMTGQALVASNKGEVLLGAIPLEDMDLRVDPVHQTLTGVHGDEVLCMLKGIKRGKDG